MESLAIPSAAPDAGDARAETEDDAQAVAGGIAVRARASRTSVVPRSRPPPRMSFGHDVLLALIMAVAMAATVFLYR